MCDSHTHDAACAAEPATDREFLVNGMHCEPCATRVTGATLDVPGVTGVDVDLATGRLSVTGTASDAAIITAVTQAGYTVGR